MMCNYRGVHFLLLVDQVLLNGITIRLTDFKSIVILPDD